MPVYFIRSGDTGPVKIGWAADVEKRRKELQTSHPYPLQIVRVIPVARGSEQWLQRRYEATKLLGEWFVFDADMLTVDPPDLATRKRPKAKKPTGLVVTWSAKAIEQAAPFLWQIETKDRARKRVELNRLVKLYEGIRAAQEQRR